MRKFHAFAAAAAVITAVAAAGSANAGVTVTSTSAAGTVNPGFTVVQNFNSGTSFAGLSGTNGTDFQVCTGNVTNICAVPNGSNTQYIAVLGGKSVTYTLANAAKEFEFDWGTASDDNTLTVFTTDGPVGGQAYTFPASNAAGGLNNPNYGQNFLTVASSTGYITAVKFASGQNSFEVDNFAVKGAVPEPATWAMMIIGFGLMGAGMRSRRTAVRFANA